MNADNFVLPEYWKIAKKPESNDLNPLEHFIWYNEPADDDQAEVFRKELEDAIKYLLKNAKNK